MVCENSRAVFRIQHHFDEMPDEQHCADDADNDSKDFHNSFASVSKFSSFSTLHIFHRHFAHIFARPHRKIAVTRR